MTDWSLDNSNKEAPMFDDKEWVRDFFATNSKYFSDDRDRATFRRYLEENRIDYAEAPEFLNCYRQGREKMEEYLSERENRIKKEEIPPTQDAEILPFKKPDEEKPKSETEHKTAA